MSNDQSPIDRMQREQILAERSSLALMQTGMNNVGLSEMRPNQVSSVGCISKTDINILHVG